MDVKQVALDFADQLPSGYRFNPTDLELIVDYLDAKINSKELPPCRLHEVNIYNHKPEELAERYRSHDNAWYFLTLRDRKYQKGGRPTRVVGESGVWKCNQKHTEVKDATGKIVGNTTTLTFFENGRKTKWLMREYTTHGPNLPFVNADNGNKQLLDKWVLCMIYMKENAVNSDFKAEEVGNSDDVILVPKRRRVSQNHHEQVDDVEERNSSHVGTHVQMATRVEIQQSVNQLDIRGPLTAPINVSAHTGVNQTQSTSNASTAFQFSDAAAQPRPLDDYGAYTTPAVHGLNSIQPLLQIELPENIFSSTTACNGLFSDGAVNYSFMEPRDYGGYATVLDQTPSNYDVHDQQDVQNSYDQDSPTLLDDMQNGCTQSMVMAHDVADHSTQPDGDNAATSAPDECEWTVETVESNLAKLASKITLQ